MTPALAIASLDALPAAIASWRPDLVVSIHSASRPMKSPWMGRWIPMAFQDREAMAPMPEPMGAMVTRVSMPRAAMDHARPMRSHVSAIVEAMKAHTAPHGEAMGGHGLKLLINCHAGLGRSPAIGIVALMAWNVSAEAAVRAVADAVPEASPNRLVLRHAEALMGQAIVPMPRRRGRTGGTCCTRPGGGAPVPVRVSFEAPYVKLDALGQEVDAVQAFARGLATEFAEARQGDVLGLAGRRWLLATGPQPYGGADLVRMSLTPLKARP